MDMNPDFNLRNLEDYTEKDLDILFDAITIAETHPSMSTQKNKQSLNVWQYRIKDAMALARKRENETH